MAERLHYANPDEMLRDMTTIQWLRWRVFVQQVEPPSDQFDNHRMAVLAAEIWNATIWANTRAGKQPKFRSWKEFFLRTGDAPDPTAPTRSQSEKDKWAVLKSWVTSVAKRKD